MPQTMYGLFGEDTRTLEMPDANQEVMPGIKWGHFDQMFSPAFWYGQAWLDSSTKRFSCYRIGATLREEVAACLLGGYGIPAEVGLAAFRAMCASTILKQESTSTEEIYGALSQPLQIGERRVRYRFASQKSNYLAATLNKLSRECPPAHSARAFRGYFLHCKGVGPKTASWITRNWLDSSDVAIIDIHIHRAGLLCGFFDHSQSVARDYFSMEERFLRFANALQLQASTLDSIIWKHMKLMGRYIFVAFPSLRGE
jgi:thermostable 8-oxoguanine DNA glycosylase